MAYLHYIGDLAMLQEDTELSYIRLETFASSLGGQIKIGRSPECQITLLKDNLPQQAKTAVSRVHAIITAVATEANDEPEGSVSSSSFTYYVSDQKSTNGTFVNGVRITPFDDVRIHPNDEIVFGGNSGIGIGIPREAWTAAGKLLLQNFAFRFGIEGSARAMEEEKEEEEEEAAVEEEDEEASPSPVPKETTNASVRTSDYVREGEDEEETRHNADDAVEMDEGNDEGEKNDVRADAVEDNGEVEEEDAEEEEDRNANEMDTGNDDTKYNGNHAYISPRKTEGMTMVLPSNGSIHKTNNHTTTTATTATATTTPVKPVPELSPTSTTASRTATSITGNGTVSSAKKRTYPESPSEYHPPSTIHGSPSSVTVPPTTTVASASSTTKADTPTSTASKRMRDSNTPSNTTTVTTATQSSITRTVSESGKATNSKKETISPKSVTAYGTRSSTGSSKPSSAITTGGSLSRKSIDTSVCTTTNSPVVLSNTTNNTNTFLSNLTAVAPGSSAIRNSRGTVVPTPSFPSVETVVNNNTSHLSSSSSVMVPLNPPLAPHGNHLVQVITGNTLCTLCECTVIDAVVANCGDLFCRRCFESAIKSQVTSLLLRNTKRDNHTSSTTARSTASSLQFTAGDCIHCPVTDCETVLADSSFLTSMVTMIMEQTQGSSSSTNNQLTVNQLKTAIMAYTVRNLCIPLPWLDKLITESKIQYVIHTDRNLDKKSSNNTTMSSLGRFITNYQQQAQPENTDGGHA